MARSECELDAAPRPVVCSIAGTDSGGGAGLSADQRAADAFGVHLCPVVAAVTAQNSLAVTHIEPMPVALIDAQLAAVAADFGPLAVKTGLLGGAAQVRCVAEWVDRLRAARPDRRVALVVDPVLAASTGKGFADAETLAAYRELLLPRATLITPNRREARLLLGEPAIATDGADDAAAAPRLARALRALGAGAVSITGGDSAACDGRVIDWIDTPHASGWLAGWRVETPHRHGTGCTHASSAAAALALGFVAADAVVLAKMATVHALRAAYAAGAGAGPVRAQAGFAQDAAQLPQLSWDELPQFGGDRPAPAAARPIGLYAIVDSAERLRQVLAGGVRTVQLRIKTPESPDAAWHRDLTHAIAESVVACREAGAALYVNDHWRQAAAAGAYGVHLGQEDLLALGAAGRAELAATGLALGVSSHSPWELARAATLAPRYVACGPVWPTLTKAMPWRAQGLDNLRWWTQMAPAPVVAIGGILEPAQARAAAACGPDGVCVVRGLGAEPAAAIARFQAAWTGGMPPADAAPAIVDLPHSPLDVHS